MPTLPIGRGASSLSRSLDETCSSCSVVQSALKFEANIGFSERSKASWKNHPSLLKFPPVGWHGSWQNQKPAPPFHGWFGYSVSIHFTMHSHPTLANPFKKTIFEPSPPTISTLHPHVPTWRIGSGLEGKLLAARGHFATVLTGLGVGQVASVRLLHQAMLRIGVRNVLSNDALNEASLQSPLLFAGSNPPKTSKTIIGMIWDHPKEGKWMKMTTLFGSVIL